MPRRRTPRGKLAIFGSNKMSSKCLLEACNTPISKGTHRRKKELCLLRQQISKISKNLTDYNLHLGKNS
jgi:hypothetical protein